MSYNIFNPDVEVNSPKFWLAKPNKQIVSRLKEIDSTAILETDFGKVNEIRATIPYKIERNQKTITNPNFSLVKGKFLIKMEFMNIVEWFVIEEIEEVFEDYEELPITAYSLQYSLSHKMIYEIEVTSVKLSEIIDSVLEDTLWSLGAIAIPLRDKHRSLEFSNMSVLDALYDIADAFGGILKFDTVNQTISVESESDSINYSGLMLNQKNYIQTLRNDKKSLEITTRLFPIGAEGLMINGVNPTGSSYIEDFSYFMYPFERDSQGNVLQSSDYMSDELCSAILDYHTFIDSKKDAIKNKYDDLVELMEEKTAIDNSLREAELELDIINDRLDAMNKNDEYYYHKFVTGEKYSEAVREGYYWTQARTSGGTATVRIDGVLRTVTSSWFNLRIEKPDEGLYVSVEPVNLNGNTLEIFFARIPIDEFTNFTDTQLLERYNRAHRQDNVDHQQLLSDRKQDDIDIVAEELMLLKNELSVERHFTPKLLEEKHRYIFENYWIEDTHIDAQELYDDAVEKMKEIGRPSVSMSISISSFLNSLEDRRNWNKLKLGSKLLVKHDSLDIMSEAILVGVTYDFENEDIDLLISDTKDFMSDEEWLEQKIYSTSSSANSLALKKFIYDDASEKTNELENILNGVWDANLRRIVAGDNNSVEIGKRGIIIRDPNFPNEILIAQSGILAISSDNGETFKNAITSTGIVGELIFGKVLVGERLWIQDENGILTLRGDILEIKDDKGNTRVELGQYEEGQYGLRINGGSLQIVGGLPLGQLDESIERRIYEAEMKVTDSSIVNTVMSSTEFNLTMEDKANTEDLADYATNETLEETEERLRLTQEELDRINNAVFEQKSQLDQLATSISARFSSGGGVNLVLNSVGFAELTMWGLSGAANRYGVTQTIELEELGYYSGFSVTPGTGNSYLKQNVNIIKNVDYTLSFMMAKRSSSGNFTVNIRDAETDTLLGTYSALAERGGFFDSSITFRTIDSSITIEIVAEAGVLGVITGIMLNIGTYPISWTLAAGEVFNTNVRMDLNGLRVIKSEEGSIVSLTAMTPEKFAAYQDMNQDGIIDQSTNSPDEVFRIDKDEFVMKKARVREEINMGTVKLISIDRKNTKGWAFVGL